MEAIFTQEEKDNISVAGINSTDLAITLIGFRGVAMVLEKRIKLQIDVLEEVYYKSNDPAQQRQIGEDMLALMRSHTQAKDLIQALLLCE